jgi:hypothetical protein
MRHPCHWRPCQPCEFRDRNLFPRCLCHAPTRALCVFRAAKGVQIVCQKKSGAEMDYIRKSLKSNRGPHTVRRSKAVDSVSCAKGFEMCLGASNRLTVSQPDEEPSSGWNREESSRKDSSAQRPFAPLIEHQDSLSSTALANVRV